MKLLNKNLLPIFAVTLVALILATNQYFKKSEFNFLETSVLSAVKELATDYSPSPADLEISNVTLSKIANPKKDFDFYTYNATVVIKNNGGKLINSGLVLHVEDDQRHSIVRNTDNGFTLDHGAEYTINNYEVAFDGDYNTGELQFHIELVDFVDSDEDNNYFSAPVSEFPSKIKSIFLEEVLEDGTMVVDFDALSFSVRKHDFEVYISNGKVVGDSDLKYNELTTKDGVYSYFRSRISEDIIQHEFEVTDSSLLNAHFIELEEDPYTLDKMRCTYVKATNPATKYSSYSDVLCFGTQKPLSRADAAKLFVEAVDESLSNSEESYFEDVAMEDWYAPYSNALFELGLFDINTTEFEPNKKITRDELLQLVLAYFKTDLSKDSDLSLPDEPATKYFLNNLIDVYKESN